MKKGYDIGQFQRSGEISLHFGIWLIWGLKLTIRNSNIGMVQKMAFKTQTETVTSPPPCISYPKKTPHFGVTNSTS